MNLTKANESGPPGVIEGLTVIIKETRDQLRNEFEELQKLKKIEKSPTIELIKNTQISDLFFKSILLHSEKKYLEMVNLNECYLYALLENGLLKSALGKVDQIILTSNGEKFLIGTKSYTQQIYKFKCQKFAQYSKIFDEENLKKTVLSLKYQVPKNRDECEQLMSDWKKNDYLPYLCKVPHIIKRGEQAQLKKQSLSKKNLGGVRKLDIIIYKANRYLKDIPFFERSYLKNLCNGIEDQNKFCKPYIEQDGWTQILNGEIPAHYLHFKCLNLYGKDSSEKLSQYQLKKCVKRMQEEPSLCTTKTANGFPSLFPRPNCGLIAKAITKSRLKVNYHDCPGQIANGAAINLHRIISHFTKEKKSESSNTCSAKTIHSLYLLNQKANEVNDWPLKICYDDKIEDKEICHEYIPGPLKGISISEEKIITKIINRTIGLGKNNKCQIISKKTYNPALLEYKNGCHIVFDEKKCLNSFCKKRVYVEEKEYKGLRYIGNINIDYIPNTWSQQKKSIFKMLDEALKHPSKNILNLTLLEVYLRLNNKGVLHGIACSEDILPRFFKRQSFNQCKPLPFIVDGVLKENNNMLLVTRTSIDDIHSPRLIPWNWVFTGIMKYQRLQPLNQWTLYGIK